MNVSSKITQKLAALFILTMAVTLSNEFADGGFVRAQSGSNAVKASQAENAVKTTAQVSQPAPDFTLVDALGEPVSLGKLKGKIVVLEWFNHGCPFVKKHYDCGNMQSLQKNYTGKGVVWLSICSSAKGKQGYATAEEHLKAMTDKKASPSHILIDAEGKVGHLYGAKTTPHMYVIDKSGKLVYAGAIDDKSSTDSEDVKTSKNYVKVALDQLLKGKIPDVATTDAYGCSIKYQ